VNVSVANASPPDVVQIWRLVDSARRCRDDGAVTAGARAGAETITSSTVSVTVLHILALILIGGLIWISILSLPLFLAGGLRWDDIRSLLLHYAYRSFTFEGDVIPGVRPSLERRLVIQAISPEDDARRALMTKAIAIAEQRRRPRSGKVRLRLRMSARMGQGLGMSLALQQTRWFTAPVLGRSVSVTKALAWASVPECTLKTMSRRE